MDLPHSDQGPHSGTPLILLHGYPLDHRMWSKVRDALVAAGHRIIVPDLRGFGKAPAGAGTMREYASDVLRLADRVGIQRFALAGFSMGGYVAMEVCRQAKGRIVGLALLDTRADADTDAAKQGRYQTIEKVKAQGIHVVAEAMLPKLVTKLDLKPEVNGWMLAQHSEGVIAALQAMATRVDSRETLATMNVPTLVIVGEKDEITPPALAEEMATLTKGKLVTVPGSAHLTPVEGAGVVGDAMVEWARQLS